MNILTFDIEDWFHILDNPETKGIEQWSKFDSRLERNLDVIFSVLSDLDQKATFFVVGWMAEKYPDQIRRIVDLGHEVGSHTHLHQLIFEQTPQGFNCDLKKSINTLENCTGRKVYCFRAPGFSLTENTLWAFDSLLENGISIDSSIFPAVRAHGGFKGFGVANPVIIEYRGMRLKEFPINTTKIFGKDFVFSGGGYFRLLPYRFLKKLTVNSDYIMSYLHPRDFDVNQPMLPGLNLMRKFKSYYGLQYTEIKLRNWLSDFNFVDIKEADEQIIWNECSCINIE